MAKKSSTGIAEMLGNLMSSQAFQETANRMDNIQGLRSVTNDFEPPSPSINKSIVISDPVIDPVLDLSPQNNPVTVIDPYEDKVDISKSSNIYYPDNEPVNYPDNNAAIYPVLESANKPDNEPVQPDKYPVEPGNYPAKNPTNKPVNEPDNEPDIKPVIYPTNKPDNETANDPAKISTIKNACIKIDPELWYPYTEKQGRVLIYLIEAGGRTKRETIANDTDVNIATVKYSLRVFVKDGYISPTTLDINHTMRGFAYSLNPHLCNEYISRIKGAGYTSLIQSVRYPGNEPVRYPGNKSHIKPDNKPVHYPDNNQNSPFSSKVFKEDLNLTTTGTGICEDPELKFWKGEGVTEKQIQNWMTEFQLSHDEIVMSLRYGRFDILERGDVNNSANWFYKILTRNGFYPKPANYRSLSEIKAEALLQQQERDREARLKIEAIEFEAKFQAFLEDSESHLFKELFDKIGSFAKDQFKDGERMAAEIELKDLFKIYLKTA